MKIEKFIRGMPLLENIKPNHKKPLKKNEKEKAHTHSVGIQIRIHNHSTGRTIAQDRAFGDTYTLHSKSKFSKKYRW